MQKRHLDGVADCVNLVTKATDIAVGHIRNVLEDEVRNFLAFKNLENEGGFRVNHEVIAPIDTTIQKFRNDVHDALFIGVNLNEHTRILKLLYGGRDKTCRLVRQCFNGYEVLIEAHLLALCKRFDVNVGGNQYAQLSTIVEDIDLVVLDFRNERAERRRRIRE